MAIPYAPRILTDNGDTTLIRATCMGLLGVNPARAAALVPDSTIKSYEFLGRAEQSVIARVGNDWSSIAAGNALGYYAGGDQTQAQYLLRDAVLMFTCAYLTPVLEQVIPIDEQSEMERSKIDLNWRTTEESYHQQAVSALGLLIPLVAVKVVAGPSPCIAAAPIPTNP